MPHRLSKSLQRILEIEAPLRSFFYESRYANRDPAGIANKPWRFPDHYGEASKTPLRDVEIKPGKQQLDFDIKGNGR